MTISPVNCHDSTLFSEALIKLVKTARRIKLDIMESYLTLDSGFDSKETKNSILDNKLIPAIKPNLRNTQDKAKIRFLFNEFSLVKHIYNERHKIERCFAWSDTYRKLVIRYEKLQSLFMGFRYLAYTMINLRWFLGKT